MICVDRKAENKTKKIKNPKRRLPSILKSDKRPPLANHLLGPRNIFQRIFQYKLLIVLETQ